MNKITSVPFDGSNCNINRYMNNITSVPLYKSNCNTDRQGLHNIYFSLKISI